MYTQRLIGALLLAALLLLPAGSALAQDGSIVDIAVGDEEFSTLVAALVETGLAEDLAADGPFTVFAPTNEAFAALPEGLLDTLRGDPTGDLTDILLYHVLPGQVMAADLRDGLEAETLHGGVVVFRVDGAAAEINQSSIIATDIVASNGVIHAIDLVLLPPSIIKALTDSAADSEEMADPTATPVAEEEAVTEEDVAAEATPEAAEDAEEEATPEVEEAAVADGPSVIATDQTSTNGAMVTIDAVNATESGWLVVHLDQDGRPGAVIGQTAVPTGDTQNVVVFLDEAISGETVLWAMLHVDAGEAGVYEFPGADVPARIDDDIVMTAFTVSAPAAAVPEMTPTPVAEAEAEMAEPTATPAAEEEGEDDEEMMAPTSLPATGGGMTGAPLAISVAALFLLGLAAVTLRKRRHLV